MRTTPFAAALTAISFISSAAAAPASAVRASKRQSTTDPNLDIPEALQNILDNTHGSDLYTYPTDFTRGIIPKPIHSHNDYWRPLPFYTALSHGCISIEADVYLHNSTLLTGHEPSALTTTRTFTSLYIDPILSVLKRENPASPFLPSSAPTTLGVYDASASQTLYLFVDVKTDGAQTWPFVIEALEPLRAAGYLSTYNGSSTTKGPITVIGTGNTPLSQIAGVSPRDYFFDANLALLSSSQSNMTVDVAPIASTQFSRYVGEIEGAGFNETQRETVREQLRVAAEKGIGGRYWDTPAWPVARRNAVWRELVDAGVALLNADDLAAAAGFTSEW